jgi:hypothetical protein
MTKGDILDLVLEYFGVTADKEKQYHPLVVEKWLSTAFNTVLYNLCLAGIRHSDYAQLDPFIFPYKVGVICDTERNEYYSKLPVSVVALPENRGIYRISPVKDQKFQFIFRENGTSDIYDSLEYSMIRKKPTFYIENSKIFYDNKMTKELADAGVLMKLIPTFDDIDDDEDIPLPGGKDNDILKLIISELAGKKGEDMRSNSKPENPEDK